MEMIYAEGGYFMEYQELLKPKSMVGMNMEYILGDTSLTIVNSVHPDSSRRKLEIPLEMVGRFISELQEVEKICEIPTRFT